MPTTDTQQESQEFFLGWYGKKVATLSYNGAKFGFDYESGWLMPLESYSRKPGELPKYLYNLLPSHIIDSVGPEVFRLMAANLGSRERFLANISVVKDPALLASVIQDRLGAKLADHADADRVFKGTVSPNLFMSRELIADIDDLIATKRVTQFSGSQTKLALNLGDDGILTLAELATGLPSTHILKYSGFGGDVRNLRGSLEWACMDMAQAGGVTTAEFALVEMDSPDGKHLHYLTERFDIPDGEDDGRLIFCEELGGAIGMTPFRAFGATLHEVIPKFAELTTRPREDMEHFMRQIAANLIMENGDFHARNLAVLKVANPSLAGWRSIRLAPAYDMMRTREFATEALDDDRREALKMTCYDPRSEDPIDMFAKMNFDGFAATADMMGMSQERARDIVAEVAAGMEDRANTLLERLPPVFDNHPEQGRAVRETADVVANNACELLRSLDPPVRPRGPR